MDEDDEYSVPETVASGMYKRTPKALALAYWHNFLGHASVWFKLVVVGSLVLNTILRWTAGLQATSIALLVEFIFMLVMALECYPLQSGGLLVVHAVIIGLTNVDHILHEIEVNLPVILLLIFTVACIHFLKNIILLIFTQLLLKIANKRTLSVIFLLASAIMSVFLNALTVIAVVLSVCSGLLGVYYHVVRHKDLPRINYERRNEMQYELFPRIRRGPTKEKLTSQQVDDLLRGGQDPRQQPPLPRKSRAESYENLDEIAGGIRKRLHSKIASQISRETLTSIPEREVRPPIKKAPRPVEMDPVKLEEQKGTAPTQTEKGSLPTKLKELEEPLPFKMPSFRVVSQTKIEQPAVLAPDGVLTEEHKRVEHDMGRFRAFLRSLIMHAAVGTSLGGIITKVGEPQNLIVADLVGWDFIEFIISMFPVWGVTLPLGIAICIVLESMHHFGYGTRMPSSCREVLQDFALSEYGKMETAELANLSIQLIGALLLMLGLVFQWAEVGLVGLMVIIVVSSFNGLILEHEIAESFEDAMPFVSLIIVFFGVVAVLDDNEIFVPVIDFVLSLEENLQPGIMYLANGVLSMVSDNVFVATIFIDQIAVAAEAVNSTLTQDQYERLSISVVAGSNLPSMATPNGSAAFLFVLTSNVAPIVGLNYRKMTLMAAPYTIVLTVAGLLAVIYLT